MRALFGKRIGQSGQELVPAVFFSFVLHVLFFFTALVLYGRVTPRIHVPPFYNVTLVEETLELPEIQPTPPPAPKIEEKPREKQVEARKEVKKTPDKEAMPELQKKKDKPEKDEDRPAEPARKQEAVTVATAQEFKFPPYLALIRDKIERNWNPPPGARGTRAKVTFTIYRSGRVADASLAEGSGNFYFDQAAMRAILASSPFPPLPEGFFREYEVFSVDLMEHE